MFNIPIKEAHRCGKDSYVVTSYTQEWRVVFGRKRITAVLSGKEVELAKLNDEFDIEWTSLRQIPKSMERAIRFSLAWYLKNADAVTAPNGGIKQYCWFTGNEFCLSDTPSEEYLSVAVSLTITQSNVKMTYGSDRVWETNVAIDGEEFRMDVGYTTPHDIRYHQFIQLNATLKAKMKHALTAKQREAEHEVKLQRERRALIAECSNSDDELDQLRFGSIIRCAKVPTSDGMVSILKLRSYGPALPIAVFRTITTPRVGNELLGHLDTGSRSSMNYRPISAVVPDLDELGRLFGCVIAQNHYFTPPGRVAEESQYYTSSRIGNTSYTTLVLGGAVVTARTQFLGITPQDLMRCLLVETNNLLLLGIDGWRGFTDSDEDKTVFNALLDIAHKHAPTHLENVPVGNVLVSTRDQAGVRYTELTREYRTHKVRTTITSPSDMFLDVAAHANKL